MSLRTAFVILTAVCILLAVKAKQIRNQRRSVDAILAAGGRIHYDDRLDPRTGAAVTASWPRRWLIENIGPEYFAKVSGVTLYPTPDENADQQVKMLAGIPYLQRLAIWPGDAEKSSHDPSALGGLTDEGLRYVSEHLPNLRHLSLLGSTVTSQGLRHLEALDGLESFQVGGFQNQPIQGLGEFMIRNPHLNN